MVENGQSKDKGDNADAMRLYERGAIERRSLNLQRIYRSGIMHSKFIISDEKDFYLGSANLDWRSLNQKLEMGVLVRDCPCLAKELKGVFDLYWKAAAATTEAELTQLMKAVPPLSFNMNRPLRVKYHDVESDVYIAVSFLRFYRVLASILDLS
jgi:phospholipase D3/4